MSLLTVTLDDETKASINKECIDILGDMYDEEMKEYVFTLLEDTTMTAEKLIENVEPLFEQDGAKRFGAFCAKLKPQPIKEVAQPQEQKKPVRTTRSTRASKAATEPEKKAPAKKATVKKSPALKAKKAPVKKSPALKPLEPAVEKKSPVLKAKKSPALNVAKKTASPLRKPVAAPIRSGKQKSPALQPLQPKKAMRTGQIEIPPRRNVKSQQNNKDASGGRKIIQISTASGQKRKLIRLQEDDAASASRKPVNVSKRQTNPHKKQATVFNITLTGKSTPNLLTPPKEEEPEQIQQPATHKKQEAKVRCTFFPNCTNPNCAFLHPTEPCPYGRNCRYDAKTCMYIHTPPPCRFGAYCTNPKCVFSHEKVQTPSCRFGANCKNPSCIFSHPGSERICRFDEVGCTNKFCKFAHPSRDNTNPAVTDSMTDEQPEQEAIVE